MRMLATTLCAVVASLGLMDPVVGQTRPAAEPATRPATRPAGPTPATGPAASLFEAVKAGNLEAVRTMLAERPDLLESSGGQRGKDTPLIFACELGQKAIAEFLLSSGADKEARNFRGDTAIQRAAFAGQAELVKLMLDKGANVRHLGGQNSDTLIFAAYGNSPECIDLLVQAGLKPDVTHLIEAAGCGRKAAVEKFLALGVEAGSAELGGAGGTALHAAATPRLGEVADYQGCAELLIAKGADVGARDKAGDTPLHRAAAAGNINRLARTVAEVLLANKADINARNAAGETPLHVTARCGPAATAMARLLLDRKADTTIKDNSGRTALEVAEKTNNRAVMNLLRPPATASAPVGPATRPVATRPARAAQPE